jgi:hypothetical protein
MDRYNTSIKVTKDTKLHVYAHYDNSPNNKFNPNPNKVVYYGDMTWDEMMFPSWGVVVEDKTIDQKSVVKRIPGTKAAVIATRGDR